MYRQPIFVILLTVVMLLPITGCSKQEASAPAATKETPAASRQKETDPCALLSVDEVVAVAGKPFKPGKRQGNECSFESAEVSADYSTLMLIVTPNGAKPFERTRQMREKSAAVRDLPGFGDAAFSSGKDIDILKKGVWLSVRPIGKAFSQQQAETLAKQAASRLQ